MANRRRVLSSALLACTTIAIGLASRAEAGEPVRIEEPPPGKALVVFYRRWSYSAAAVSYIVREGQVELGLLSVGSYFVVPVDPGLHTFTVHAERHSDMQLLAEAGEIYYVRFDLDIGVVLYQPDLTPSEQRLFDEVSAKLRLSAPLAAAQRGGDSAPQ